MSEHKNFWVLDHTGAPEAAEKLRSAVKAQVEAWGKEAKHETDPV